MLHFIRKYPGYFSTFVIFIIFAAGILLQSYLLLNDDACWATHISERILQGGKYYYNYFENNPPLAFYVNIPAALLANVYHLGIIIGVRIYIFLLIGFSFLFCMILMRKLFLSSDSLRYILPPLLAAIFILQPAIFFGEREHIALILTLPYFFLATLRAQNKSVSYTLAIVISLFSGTGFLIKPFFIAPFMLVEIYLLTKLKFKNWLRYENSIITSMICLYPMLVFVFAPEYIFKMIPYAVYLFAPYYSDHSSWVSLFTTHAAMFYFGVLGLYLVLLHQKIIESNELCNIIAFGASGFFIAYACQLLVVGYHEIPTLDLTTILAVLILSEYIRRYQVTNVIGIAVTLMIFLWVPLSYSYQLTIKGFQNRKSVVFNQLVDYTTKNFPHSSVYFFTTDLGFPFPFIDYAKVQMHSRFPSFWFLIGMILDPSKQNHSHAPLISIQERKEFFIRTVIQELQKQQPKVVYVFTPVTWRFASLNEFDYIKFFSQDSEFRKLWRHYQHAARIGDVEIYKRV